MSRRCSATKVNIPDGPIRPQPPSVSPEWLIVDPQLRPTVLADTLLTEGGGNRRHSVQPSEPASSCLFIYENKADVNKCEISWEPTRVRRRRPIGLLFTGWSLFVAPRGFTYTALLRCEFHSFNHTLLSPGLQNPSRPPPCWDSWSA